MRILLAIIFLAPALPAAAQTVISTTTLTVEQLYAPVNLRDPLLPSTTFGDSKKTGAKETKSGQPAVAASSFTIYGLALTGIMEDSRGRQALLRDTASGALYTLKAGRLTDSKKKLVPGVSGVIKGKQVILMTDDKKVNQLSLREKE